MSKKVTMAEALASIEVDLFGYDFEAKPETRSLVNECHPLEDKLDNADDPDEVIATVGQLLDIRLKATNGGRKKPSTIVKEKWEADQLSTGALLGFLADLRGAQIVRPT